MLSFLLFFGSFDAIVLIASIYILFPHDHPELRDKCTQQVYWAIERFAAMQDRNPFAKTAQGVLRAILAKLTRAVGSQGQSSTDSSTETPASMRARASTTPASSLGKAPGDALSCDAVKTSITQAPDYSTAFPPEADWALPPTDSLATIAPLFATSDLLYHDLTAMPDDSVVPLVAPMPVQDAGDVSTLGSGRASLAIWRRVRRGHGLAVFEPLLGARDVDQCFHGKAQQEKVTNHGCSRLSSWADIDQDQCMQLINGAYLLQSTVVFRRILIRNQCMQVIDAAYCCSRLSSYGGYWSGPMHATHRSHLLAVVRTTDALGPSVCHWCWCGPCRRLKTTLDATR